jgi:hypothetical protein
MTRQYTGPTGITLQNDKMHIEGYPDASRVVRLTTPTAKRLADLVLHEKDLSFCERALQIFANSLDRGQNDLPQAIWISVLTKFYSCFGDSKARSALDATKVYMGTPEAMEIFEFFRQMRNKHIVHDENNYNYPMTRNRPRAELRSARRSLSEHTLRDRRERERSEYVQFD